MEFQPFYVGQKVVALVDFETIRGASMLVKGKVYVVKGIRKALCCKRWEVDYGCIYDGLTMCKCGNIDHEIVFWIGASNFAPLHTDFQHIELSKVLEIETPLIGTN